jgi:hypothetical protein
MNTGPAPTIEGTLICCKAAKPTARPLTSLVEQHIGDFIVWARNASVTDILPHYKATNENVNVKWPKDDDDPDTSLPKDERDPPFALVLLKTRDEHDLRCGWFVPVINIEAK